MNVAAQQRDPKSLLNWLERAIRLRRRCPEFGSGKWQWLETSDPAVLAHCCPGASYLFAIHNLSSREIEVEVDLGRTVVSLVDILADREERAKDNPRQRFRMPPYGYLWLREGGGAAAAQPAAQRFPEEK